MGEGKKAEGLVHNVEGDVWCESASWGLNIALKISSRERMQSDFLPVESTNLMPYLAMVDLDGI
jgi:hypothetical protein